MSTCTPSLNQNHKIGQKQMIDQVNNAGVASSKLTYFLSSITVIFGTFTVQEWAAVTGIVLGFLTFGVNIYFKSKLLKLEVRKAESQLMPVIDKVSEK
jgi:hypothetical protein